MNKKAVGLSIELGSAGIANASATVVEVRHDQGPEVALNPPIAREVRAGKPLRLGPFAVAVLSIDI